ncbi:RES domain-containing protein [Collimonas sp. OK607]|nr:RES domain-containing protein [Collimonas sp. OK607]
MTNEKLLLASQKGWEGRSYDTLFKYTGFDQYVGDPATQSRLGIRLEGAVQAGASIAGLVGDGLACTTGLGCAAAALTGTVLADNLVAGSGKLAGQPTVTYGEQALQSLGLSPQAAAYTYAAIGLAPAGIMSFISTRAVNAEAAAYAWARGTYDGSSSIDYTGKVYRYASPEFAEGTFQIYPGNVKANFRYSPEGVGAIYSGTTSQTAAAEVASYSPGSVNPLAGKVLVTNEISINNILDLTDPAARQALGVTLEDITQAGHGTGNAYSTTQRLSSWASAYEARVRALANANMDGLQIRHEHCPLFKGVANADESET